ncbi:MAG: hypothetical protein C4326_02500 [Ignavibacteria bacterium]
MKEIADAIIAVAGEIGATKSMLFGSFERGTDDRRSDVDVVFVPQTEQRFVQMPDCALRLLDKQIRGRAIDVFISSPSERMD